MIPTAITKGISEFEIPSIVSLSKKPNFNLYICWTPESASSKKQLDNGKCSNEMMFQKESIDDDSWKIKSEVEPCS